MRKLCDSDELATIGAPEESFTKPASYERKQLKVDTQKLSVVLIVLRSSSLNVRVMIFP
jgi:cytoskeletal protein RodZ